MPENDTKFRKKINELGDLWNKQKNNGIKVVILLFLVISLFAQIFPPIQAFVSSQKYMLLAIAGAMMYIIFDSIVSTPQKSRFDQSVVAVHFTDLRPFLHTAFKQAVIEINIAAYSGETFYNLLTEFLQGVLNGIYKPRRLYLRLIVPDCKAYMFVPCEVDNLKVNEDYKKSIQERNNRFANEFVHYFSDIKIRFPEIDILLSIRKHKFSPLFKIIMIQPKIVFFGIYPLAETPINIGGENIKVWDFRGERVKMVGLQFDGTKSEVELANEVSQWFESVWKNLSEILIEI